MRIFILTILILPLVLSACSALGGPTGAAHTETPTASVAASEPAEIVVPVRSALDDLNGSTVSLNRGDFYDVVLPSGTADAWTATVETPGVVEWMPVEPDADGTAVSTLAAIGLGTTVVTLTDGTTVVSFSVSVQ